MPETTPCPLVLGPMLRHVTGTSATIWVETAQAGTVTVDAGPVRASARTFGAHGRHYALVLLDGFEPGHVYPYTVLVDGVPAWPFADSPFPASTIHTFGPDRELTLAFGSCRTSVPHDAEGNASNGIDALRAYAHAMARCRDDARWPDLLLLLGDQVYADETSPAMQEYIARRRGLEEPPWVELKDFTEYAHLYGLAYDEPAVRWLLSTLPSAMIFDDHDVRDDWNTSLAWHREMNAQPWWHDRIVGALGSYWIYQHCGNLSPSDLAQDEVWQRIVAHEGPGELDLTEHIDAFAERVDADPHTYRFSYTRDLGRNRIVVVDSRAARDLRPGRRAMLEPTELAWLDDQLRGGFDHLFIGTSLPFFMPEGIHMLEALDEVAAEGAWGPVVAGVAEKVRQAVDLEHWAAFSRSFIAVSDIVMSVARGERGPAPHTISFLSGDIHNSFLSEVENPEGTVSRIFQAVCSPIRNPLPRHVRVLQSLIGRGLGFPLRKLVALTDEVVTPPFSWHTTHGPWFDNNLATVTVRGERLEYRWEAGRIVEGDLDRPRLRLVADIRVDDDGTSRRRDARGAVRERVGRAFAALRG